MAALSFTPKSAESILAHPCFPQARRAHIYAMLDMFGGDPFLVRLMGDVACLTTAALVVGFHAAHDENDPRTWATLTRIQQLVVDNRLASSRRVNDLIARFRQTRFVETIPNDSDRRIRILRPTARLLAHDRAYLEALHAPLNVLYPDERHQRIVKLDARLHLAIRRADLHALTATVAIIRRYPAITMFSTHDAGYLALLMAAQAMSQAHHTADDGTSYTHIAQELGVSRTHVRKLFVAAERSGYVTLSPKGGRVTDIRSSLWNAFDHYLADMEASRDAIAQAAFANLQGIGLPPF